jgi:putative membrane protein
MFHGLAARAALAFFLSPPGFASGAAAVPQGDRAFMAMAARSANAEIDMGQLAMRKATLEEVRNLGARIVADHTRMADELRQLASPKGVRLPPGVTPAAAVELARLRDRNGARFDVAYTNQMVKAHEKDLRAFRKEAKSGKDADIARFAADALPVLRDHLARAQAAAAAAKALARAGAH